MSKLLHVSLFRSENGQTVDLSRVIAIGDVYKVPPPPEPSRQEKRQNQRQGKDKVIPITEADKEMYAYTVILAGTSQAVVNVTIPKGKIVADKDREACEDAWNKFKHWQAENNK